MRPKRSYAQSPKRDGTRSSRSIDVRGRRRVVVRRVTRAGFRGRRPFGIGNTIFSTTPTARRPIAAPSCAQPLDHLLHQISGADAPAVTPTRALARDPLGLQLVGAVDHVGRHAAIRRDFAQAVGVGAVRAADDDHHVDLRRHELHRVLAVLRGIADVVLLRPDDRRESAPSARRRSPRRRRPTAWSA